MTAKNTTNFAHSALFIYVHCEQFCCCCCYYYYYYYHHLINQLYAEYLQLDTQKKMFLGYTVLQLFCSNSLWYM